jgi:uncharacterized Tic20 family protein
MDNDIIEKPEEISQDSKNLALLLWVGTIFLNFIPGLIFYLTKKDDEYLTSQAIEALNWSITVILAYCVALVLVLIVIGAILFPLIGLCHMIFCIMGAVACSEGKPYRTPFAIRLMK